MHKLGTRSYGYIIQIALEIRESKLPLKQGSFDAKLENWCIIRIGQSITRRRIRHLQLQSSSEITVVILLWI